MERKEHTQKNKNNTLPNYSAISTCSVSEKSQDNKKAKESCFARNSSAIQAFSALATVFLTLGLVFFAGYSWHEAIQLRQLEFKQFVIANLPSLGIYAKNSKPEITEDYFHLVWKVANSGGPVNDMLYQAILLGFVNNKGFYPKSVIRSIKKASLGKNLATYLRLSTENSESISWIKEIKNADKSRLILVLKSTYEIPEELSLEKVAKKDSIMEVFTWENKWGRFENLKAKYLDDILEYIEKNNLFNSADAG